jgi:hypothetical protein
MMRLWIPTNQTSHPSMKPAAITVLALIFAGLSSTQAASWTKLPGIPSRPISIGSASLGTKVLSSKGLDQADGLISDDPTLPIKVPAGASEFVLDLGTQRVIENVLFTDDTIEGKVVVSGSGDGKDWIALGQSLFTPADRLVQLSFAGTQVKFVKVEFSLLKGGTIRNFQLLGAATDKDFELKFDESGEGTVRVNLATGLGGSRVVYAYPNPAKDSEVTEIGRAQATFSFPESAEKYRTIIYDLGSSRLMWDFGSVHSPRPVRFQVFTFDQLPEKEDWRGHLSFDQAALDSAAPIATVEDAQGLGFTKTTFSRAVKARYVALRWEPDFNPPSFLIAGVQVTSMVTAVATSTTTTTTSTAATSAATAAAAASTTSSKKKVKPPKDDDDDDAPPHSP